MDRVPERFSRYIEPFAGSACLFFAIRPRAAILGDLNAELIDAYSTLRTHPRLVARAAAKFAEDSTTYYRIRAFDPSELSDVVRAARFIYLNRNCFNGVYRVNRQGQFNVPMGTRTGALPGESDFVRCAIALRAAELRAGDYRDALRDVRKDDFVYLDPPYASTRRNRFGEYGYDRFDEPDLPCLLKTLRQIDRAGATFLLSYCVHPALSKIPKSWCRCTLRVRRHVAGFARHRNIVTELLISNRSLGPARMGRQVR